jgi:hypothetical protein
LLRSPQEPVSQRKDIHGNADGQGADAPVARARDGRHQGLQVLFDACLLLQIDPDEQTPGRKITRDFGQSLVAAMETALGSGNKEMAECVACEMVVHAEMTDHFNWQLIGEVAKEMTGAQGKALKEAYQEVEDEEAEHLYHSKGWLRELSLQGLGLKAQLPPPEEEREVKSAIGQARAEQSRKS